MRDDGGAARASQAGIEALLERWRPFRPRRLTQREVWVEFGAAGAFAACAAVLPLALEGGRTLDPPLALALVAAFALASRVPLYLGAGSAVPTQLLLVPMLFLLPPATVPAAVGAALAATSVADVLAGRGHPERVLSSVADGWHAVGPALVFALAGSPAARLAEWPLVGAALLAQCACDLAAATAREWLGRGIPPSLQVKVVLSVYAIDVCLTPIGLAVAVASAPHPFAFAVVVPVIALLAALAVDRRARIEEATLRLDELRRGHERLDRAIRRIGEAFASKLDRAALLNLVLRTTAEALAADYAGATLAGATSGWGEDPGPGHPRMALPLVVDDTAGELLVARRGPDFTAEERALFGYLVRQAAVALENVELHDLLRRQATVDELTGLANHRRFQDALAHEMARMRRSGRPLALLLLDIDDFKAVNDTHGHRQGDAVLQSVADVVREASRSSDEPARYGGEELALILPETDLDGACTVAETIRDAVERLRVALPGGGAVQVTVSIGVSATKAREAQAAALIEAADAGLYAAKRAGKNRVSRGGWLGAGVVG